MRGIKCSTVTSATIKHQVCRVTINVIIPCHVSPPRAMVAMMAHASANESARKNIHNSVTKQNVDIHENNFHA